MSKQSKSVTKYWAEIHRLRDTGLSLNEAKQAYKDRKNDGSFTSEVKVTSLSFEDLIGPTKRFINSVGGINAAKKMISIVEECGALYIRSQED